MRKNPGKRKGFMIALIIALLAILGAVIAVYPMIKQDVTLTRDAEEYDELAQTLKIKPVVVEEQLQHKEENAATDAAEDGADSVVREKTDDEVVGNNDDEGNAGEGENQPVETEVPELDQGDAGDGQKEEKKPEQKLNDDTDKENGRQNYSPVNNDGIISPVDKPEEYNEWLSIEANKTPVPTKAPVVTATPKPTKAPQSTGTPNPTAATKQTKAPTATVAPTNTPCATAKPTSAPVTASPTAVPTKVPAATATPNITAVPTVKPTSTPVVTAKPTEKPTTAPTATTKPTAAPTAKPTATPRPTATPGNTPVVGKTGADLAACKKINSDFIAWLQIPNTNVDYPVVLTNDIDYYLDHTFTGKKSSLGTLFSLGKTDYRTPGKNIAIYGHDVEGSGNKMFKALLQYKKASFYSGHETIYFDTMYRPGVYKIFAVFDITVGDWDPSVTTFANDKEFMEFVNRAKSLSLYKTGVDVSANDTILTLITCDRYFKKGVGRLIVMAVRVK